MDKPATSIALHAEIIGHLSAHPRNRVDLCTAYRIWRLSAKHLSQVRPSVVGAAVDVQHGTKWLTHLANSGVRFGRI